VGEGLLERVGEPVGVEEPLKEPVPDALLEGVTERVREGVAEGDCVDSPVPVGEAEGVVVEDSVGVGVKVCEGVGEVEGVALLLSVGVGVSLSVCASGAECSMVSAKAPSITHIVAGLPSRPGGPRLRRQPRLARQCSQQKPVRKGLNACVQAGQSGFFFFSRGRLKFFFPTVDRRRRAQRKARRRRLCYLRPCARVGALGAPPLPPPPTPPLRGLYTSCVVNGGGG
jgi:hypothetical protein